MKWNNTMPPLPAHVTFLEMVNHSVRVLYVNGFITRKEREKIWSRVEKDYYKEMQEAMTDGKK